MYDLIRGIPESCRQVTRSMRGSCLEVPPQFVSHGVCQEIFEYSFFMNVSRNFFVKNLIIEANEVVLHDFSQICRLVHDIKHTLSIFYGTPLTAPQPASVLTKVAVGLEDSWSLICVVSST
jgi:hypothetical protein